ncbi:hypothetical protein EON65_49455 [archaeon]|nr:MAG: hypothetical protein EON65_49455 [archaeon]
MNKLELSLNPLGEAGARSIFRTILRGLSCFVVMRNCSYTENHHVYKHTYPSHDNPYVLDLSEPYNRAVVYELLYKFQEDPTHCGFEHMSYKEAPKVGEVNIQLGINPLLEEKCKSISGSNFLVNKVCLKSTNDLYVVPRTGVLKFHFAQAVFVPTIHNIIQDKPLDILQKIVEKGVTENDKKMWLFLICQDLYFTTQQAQDMILRFKESKTVGAGGLTTLDILKR